MSTTYQPIRKGLDVELRPWGIWIVGCRVFRAELTETVFSHIGHNNFHQVHRDQPQPQHQICHIFLTCYNWHTYLSLYFYFLSCLSSSDPHTHGHIDLVTTQSAGLRPRICRSNLPLPSVASAAHNVHVRPTST